MIGLLQRVSSAQVCVAGTSIGDIGPGLLVLVCAERGDSTSSAERLLDKLLSYRVFADEAGKMNLSLKDTGGSLMLVPQFTLGADTNSGTRPSFSSVAAPDLARRLFEHLVEAAHAAHSPVASGRFGESMRVTLVNEGPVTFWLRVTPGQGSSEKP